MSTATSNLVAVKVPSVGESITSGVIGSWKKKNGDIVASGDALFEIETDKVTSGRGPYSPREILGQTQAVSGSSGRDGCP
ncbi:MAG: hypothetical protein RL549_1430 [Verrucomicrobiota bacterium]